jgi:hypothetical protein
MDLSSPKTWQDGMAAVIGAPQQWRDNAISAAIIEKIAFTVEYEDGRTARLFVSQ